MALVLIKETGDSVADANSYADKADLNAYLESHVQEKIHLLPQMDRKTLRL